MRRLIIKGVNEVFYTYDPQILDIILSLLHFHFAGLNCAEAVNFAPADWLPHGGSGAELYQLYRKAPVLSHEELLCVVAKVILHFLLITSSLWKITLGDLYLLNFFSVSYFYHQIINDRS